MSTIKLSNQITLSLSVTNREKSAKWYGDHLGFETLFAAEEAGWTELATNVPGVTIGLGDADQASPGNCVPVFGVENITTARAALETQKISFDGETQEIEGMVSFATFYDPDGNALMLFQDLSSD